MKKRICALCLLLALAGALAVPAAALPEPEENSTSVSAFAKSAVPGDVLAFSPDDFQLTGGGNAQLSAIVLTSLPDAGAGLLRLGNEELLVGDVISMNAVAGLRFYPLSAPVLSDTAFTFIPVFSNGAAGENVTVSVYLLSEANAAPAADALELCTYRNVAVNGQFSAVDPEGDLITFQLVKKPARGQVTISADGSGTFLYTPYENKTGKDTFTYVAIDSYGNVSPEAVVKVTISKAKTKVTYADMEGNSAHKAAIRLAEEGIFVGACMDGAYYFQPELPVSREQFVVLAMSAAGEKALEGVSVTGFADDAAIPAWAKGYLSSALMAGAVRGTVDGEGAVSFYTGADITRAEAAAVLSRLLRAEDVDAAAFAEETVPAWASQAAANLAAASIQTGLPLSETLTRGEAAELLCAFLEYRDSQKTGWFG